MEDRMGMAIALQTAGEVARARYFGGMRLLGFLVAVILVLVIVYLIKRIMK
jgi:hypothetical protein